MAFIRALLGGLDSMVEWARGGDASGDAASWAVVPGEESLLEGLVRAASRDPDRLEPVRQTDRGLPQHRGRPAHRPR